MEQAPWAEGGCYTEVFMEVSPGSGLGAGGLKVQ
jgi:hypothetical protein